MLQQKRADLATLCKFYKTGELSVHHSVRRVQCENRIREVERRSYLKTHGTLQNREEENTCKKAIKYSITLMCTY